MISERIKSYVPDVISQNAIFSMIYDTQGAEMDLASLAIEELLDQCFVDTATWGLAYWEKLLNIETDELKPDEYRRSVIKSAIRGNGTVTVSMIKSVSESYDNGEIDVIEHNDMYSFEVKFIGTKGIPPNLDDLKLAIDKIKPAHLSVTYTFTYTIWGEVKEATWAGVKTGTWGELKTRQIV